MIDFNNKKIIKLSKANEQVSEDSWPLFVEGELQLWFSGLGHVKFEFTGSCNIIEIGQVIGNAVL